MILLAGLLPHLPSRWVERYFDLTKTSGPGDLSALAAAASHLDARQLDQALELIEADLRSHGKSM